MMVRNRIARPLVTLGLADTFAHGASRRFLMREHGLDAKAITAAAEQLIGTQLGLVDSDFSTVRIEAVHSNARAEAM
jgi:transketolase